MVEKNSRPTIGCQTVSLRKVMIPIIHQDEKVTRTRIKNEGDQRVDHDLIVAKTFRRLTNRTHIDLEDERWRDLVAIGVLVRQEEEVKVGKAMTTQTTAVIFHRELTK